MASDNNEALRADTSEALHAAGHQPPSLTLAEPTGDTLSPDTQEKKNSRWQKLRRYAGKAAVISTLGLTGALGSLTAVSEVPASVNLGPGLSAEASPIFANYSGVTYGSTFGIPKLHTRISGVDVGGRLTIDKLDTLRYDDHGQTLASIFSDPEDTIVPEAKKAMYWRAGEGGIGGAIVAGLGMWSLAGWRRRRKSRLQAEDLRRDQLEETVSLPDEERANLPPSIINKLDAERDELAALKTKKQKYNGRRSLRKLGAVAAGISLFAGGSALAHHDIDSLTPPATSRSVVFSKDSKNPYIRNLVADTPILDGTFVTGDVGHLVVKGLQAVGTRMEKVNAFWRDNGNIFANKVLPDFLTENGIDLHSPDTVLIVDTTDVHDNRPFLAHYLPQVLAALNPDFVINTGDEENYSGTLFLDNGAAKRLANALPVKNDTNSNPTRIIKVVGNHGEKNSAQARKLTFKTPDGTTYHPIIPLDESNNYTYTIDGIPLVGSPDINRTTPDGTKPADRDSQLKNDAEQGKLLAKRACEVYAKTGKKPIVLGHEPESTYAAAATSGCTSLALSGHTHVTGPLKVFQNPDGSLTYLQNLGTASGDGPNNLAAIYNMPTIRADMSFWLMNKNTGKSQEFLISLGPNDNEPTIQKMEPLASEAKTSATSDPEISAFLEQYDPAALQHQTPSLASRGSKSKQKKSSAKLNNHAAAEAAVTDIKHG